MRNLPEFESRVRFIVIFLFSFCSSWKLNLFSQTGWKFYLERQRDIVANDWNKCLNARECIPKELIQSMPVDILYSGIHSLRKDDRLLIFLSTSLWTLDWLKSLPVKERRDIVGGEGFPCCNRHRGSNLVFDIFWYMFLVCFWYILIHFFGIFLICSDIQDCILIFHAEIDKLIFLQTIMTRNMFWWFLLTQLARRLKPLFLWFSSWCWHVTFCRNWYVSCTKMTFSMNHRFAPSTSDHINIW